jgi:hypothetical protein
MQPIKKFFSLLVLSIFVVQLISFSPVFAQSEDTEFSTTIQYLADQQLPDGGFPGLSEGSDPGTTARALLAMYAIGVDPNQFVSEEDITAVEYLLKNYPTNIFDENQLLFPGNAGLILASLSLFEAAPDELPQLILDTIKEDGSFSTDAVQGMAFGSVTDLSQALAILGLAAHGDAVPVPAIEYLIQSQMEDATWSNGFGSDPDTTALVVIALLASGQIDREHQSIQNALQYFRETQLENAGWRPIWDSSMINVDSTGWITLALISAGEDLEDWQVNGSTPQDALRSVIKPDGSIGDGFINVYSTVEALLGFSAGPLVQPLSRVEEIPAEETTNQAGLAVTLPDGNTVLRCVEFSGESISGYDLLTTSGLQVVTSFSPGMGNAVCGIEEQGCDRDNCFCGMPNYWSYWHTDDGEWVYSDEGADTYQVSAGSMDGWSWGDQAPVVVDLDDICGQDPTLFLPALVNETTEPTNAILLPLVESSAEEIITQEETTTGEETIREEILTENNYNQYIVFGVILLALVIVIVLLIKEKRKA